MGEPILDKKTDEIGQWEEIFKYAKWGIVVSSKEGKHLGLMNPAFASIHGFAVDELIGRPMADIFAKESRGDLPKQIRLAEKKGHHTFESKHLKKDGSIFPVLVDVTSVKDKLGKPLYGVINVQDITERKIIEDEILHLASFPELNPNPIFEIDFVGKILYANPAAKRLPKDFFKLSKNIIESFKGQKKASQIREMIFGDLIFEQTIYHIAEENKLRIYSFDVTTRKRAEKVVREREEKNRSLIDNVNFGVYRNTGGNGKFLKANPAIAKMFGYDSVDEFMKISVSDLYQDTEERKIFIEEISKKGLVRNKELRLKKKDGTPIWGSVTAKIHHNNKGGIEWMDGVIEDITDHKRIQDIIRHRAYHDTLTKLPNRLLFDDRLTTQLKEAKRYKEKFCVFYLDFDNFKAINDTLGHNAGDNVIKTVGHRLKSLLRESETIARLGGDEFAILFPKLSSRNELRIVANKILDASKKHIDIGGVSVYLTLSIGISFYPEDGKDLKTLIKSADTAMYQAKKEGRNNFKFYSEK